jgi:hypothetical protein
MMHGPGGKKLFTLPPEKQEIEGSMRREFVHQNPPLNLVPDVM